MLKRQQFEDTESNKTEPNRTKRQHLNGHDNEKQNDFDKDESKIKSTRYIPILFMSLFFSQKMSNRLSNLGKKTRSLNYLECIPKIC